LLVTPAVSVTLSGEVPAAVSQTKEYPAMPLGPLSVATFQLASTVLSFDQAFTKFDALVTPTSPTVPFKIGEKTGDPVQMYLSDVCTLPINIAGLPAISIPAGFTNGLPVGMQIIGKPFSEETLLKIAHVYQQVTEWHKKRPKIKELKRGETPSLIISSSITTLLIITILG
jgi:Asp-tRNA(Asn)/Glu-tRNA(Gln) amidotransferase A subunit family amidase